MRHFVVRDPLLAMRDQRGLVNARAVLRQHKRHRYRPTRAIDTHHLTYQHRRVCVQHGFDFQRINQKSRQPQHIADARQKHVVALSHGIAQIATFEKTIVSRKSKFDEFLAGNKKALSNSQLRGLHLFRTKAKCMNCHNGPLFSDNQFHNIGFSGTDEGYYKVSHKDEDIGKFKTPSLRDVMKTGPWMHDGTQKDMPSILDKFNKADKVTIINDIYNCG